MPRIEELEKSLSQYFANPQKSERWAMYRLIEDKKNKPTIPISSKVYTLFQVNQTVVEF
jgi:hypothetical protein